MSGAGEIVKEVTVEKPDAGSNAVRLVSTTRRLDTLGKLLRDAKISAAQYCAGRDYLSIVEQYYACACGLARLSDEAPHAGGQSDPIRLYAKGRRSYTPTQRPRNVVRVKTSFDGWTSARSDALKAMHRLRTTLAMIEPESLRALYALVIHPSDPNRRSLPLFAYCLKRYGFKDTRYGKRVIQHLACALDVLHREYGERLEEAA